MKESIPTHERIGLPPQLDADQESLPSRVPLSREDARRSAKNIAQWNSYLPAGCVRTMVRMGWDYTT